MDNRVKATYRPPMFARAVTMFAILAIVLFTTIAPMHAARMSAVPDHAVQMTEMMQAPQGEKTSCDGDLHYRSTDASTCEFVCVGISVFLPSPSVEASLSCSRASHARPSEAQHPGRGPKLNERPPQIRLF